MAASDHSNGLDLKKNLGSHFRNLKTLEKSKLYLDNFSSHLKKTMREGKYHFQTDIHNSQLIFSTTIISGHASSLNEGRSVPSPSPSLPGSNPGKQPTSQSSHFPGQAPSSLAVSSSVSITSNELFSTQNYWNFFSNIKEDPGHLTNTFLTRSRWITFEFSPTFFWLVNEKSEIVKFCFELR